MGANKRSGRQKCGEIFIDIRTIKNKSKAFTFHCVLCSVDCDQLKKFSKHLEKHLQYFDNDLGKYYDQDNFVFDSEEIKIENGFDADLVDKAICKLVNSTAPAEPYEDPLETRVSQKKQSNCSIERRVANIRDVVGTCESSNRTTIGEDSKRSVKICNSDELSDYLSDSDLEVKRDNKTSARIRSKNMTFVNSKRNEEATKVANESELVKSPNKNKLKRRRQVVIKRILPLLIQQYKKHEVLWQVDDIGFGIKNKKYEIYGKIAEAIKLDAKENITSEDINYHINYLSELYSKDKEQELKCLIEKIEFSPECEYYTEMSFLSNCQGPFLCVICNEILPKYDPYCQHMAHHNDSQPYKCPSCEMMFSNYHKFLIHKKRHLGILDFHCDICGKGYLFKNDLEWHITSHTGDKPYLCQICGTGFRARHGYDNHIRRHEERFRHECHICKRGFNQLYALNNHVKSHLNIRDVICKICGKGFVHTKYLKRHELIHGTEKRYKCTECGKAFFQACGLRAHRKNHHS